MQGGRGEDAVHFVVHRPSHSLVRSTTLPQTLNRHILLSDSEDDYSDLPDLVSDRRSPSPYDGGTPIPSDLLDESAEECPEDEELV